MCCIFYNSKLLRNVTKHDIPVKASLENGVHIHRQPINTDSEILYDCLDSSSR